ncbi:MAG TPA: hypothetical protein VG308_00940 [Stellaceae bacterium]|jgi:hypothetical protein|nr:hypothetical protein [Stellaceae bacterium]
MKRFIAALVAAAVLLPAGAARAAEACYSPTTLEAEQGMRFLIDLMVASTACRDQTYGLFQQRNHVTVLAYQKALITHFHGNAAYDRWDTALANDAALKQAGKSGPQACQESADVLNRGASMDDKGFRAYAASLATSAAASGRYKTCGRGAAGR